MLPNVIILGFLPIRHTAQNDPNSVAAVRPNRSPQLSDVVVEGFRLPRVDVDSQ